MEKEKIDRINELARKAKEAPLTNEEADEQNFWKESMDIVQLQKERLRLTENSWRI